MVVRIRFSLHGTRNNKLLHLIVVNSKKRRDARPIETLGIYGRMVDPEHAHKAVEWSVPRIKYWLDVGAQPSKAAVKLLTVVSDSILLPVLSITVVC
jgi:small subunit ribosomal protein S16